MRRFRGIFITVLMFLLLFSTIAYGDSWTGNKRLTNNAGNSNYPAIAVAGSNIYVVWDDNTSGNYDIYFKKSDDEGVNWTSKRLTNNTGARYPSIAVDGLNIYVLWTAYATPGSNEIYFKKSDDGGVTWSPNKRLTNNAGISNNPVIAVDGSNIYVVWCDDTPGNYEIYFKMSDDGGTTWTTNERLTWNTGYSQSPAIAVDGSNIYVVWYDYTPGNYEIYFKKSDDGGTTWTKNMNLTNNESYSFLPAVAVDGSNIYVVWYDETPGNPEIYFKKSDDGGTTWTTNERLTNNYGYSYVPAIAVDGQNIYVVWENYLLTPANYEIYFKKSEDGGVTWSGNKRLTNNTGDSRYPAIAVDGSNIYVVWQNFMPASANYEIYFNKGDMF
ncbi:MAG: hypothetical protein A2Y81_02475 [Nitrospirae bacterium RBG_13_43_8]|nr:MAG: hypothetical protein A2Y81_02475 [Nitrospirae bacterium RBG_13_43_8]